MKCLTCKEAKENCCCECGKKIIQELQKLEPNPYSEEIDNDNSLHLMCTKCKQNAMDDI